MDGIQNSVIDDDSRVASQVEITDCLRRDDGAEERDRVGCGAFPMESGDEHALDDLSRGRPQVAQLSEEAGCHGEHESCYDELQFAGLRAWCTYVC